MGYTGLLAKESRRILFSLFLRALVFFCKSVGYYISFVMGLAPDYTYDTSSVVVLFLVSMLFKTVASSIVCSASEGLDFVFYNTMQGFGI